MVRWFGGERDRSLNEIIEYDILTRCTCIGYQNLIRNLYQVKANACLISSES